MDKTGNYHLLTLDETLKDQKDLKKICEDRLLETVELFEPNAYYGNNLIIKSYARFPLDKPLKATFEHGIRVSSFPINEADRKALVPAVFYYSPLSYSLYKNQCNKVLLNGASPFVYLTKLLKDKDKPISPKGSIFFPTHSTHHITSTVDYEKLAGDLEKLDNKYKPISVCMYWRDYNLGHHKAFEQRGFRIVSAGHMYDPMFLFRLYHLCSIHKYSASNGLGSHLFYSVKSGCSFFYANKFEVIKPTESINTERGVAIPNSTIANNLYRLFSKPTEKTTPEQLEVINDFLGVKNLKTPDELRAELEFADRLDKFGFARHPESKMMYYRRPNLIPRKLLRRIKRTTVRLVSGEKNNEKMY